MLHEHIKWISRGVFLHACVYKVLAYIKLAKRLNYALQHLFVELDTGDLEMSQLIAVDLTLQPWSTFQFLPSTWMEEFKFPTSSAPSSIRGIDLWFCTCRWMSYILQTLAWVHSSSSHMHTFWAIKLRVVSVYCLRTVLSEYNS